MEMSSNNIKRDFTHFWNLMIIPISYCTFIYDTFFSFLIFIAKDLRTIVFMAVGSFVFGASSAVSLSRHILLRRRRTGKQQMVWRNIAEDWREPSGDPIGRRIGSTFRFNGSKFFAFVYPHYLFLILFIL